VPKQPTFSVYHWLDGEYQVTLFRDQEPIVSPMFPELALTLAQVLQGSQFSIQE
jgi:Uma2 family endonuclease